MTIELGPAGPSLSRGLGHERTSVGSDNLDAVSSYAKATKAADARAHEVVISATANTPLQHVITAVAAARDSGRSLAFVVVKADNTSPEWLALLESRIGARLRAAFARPVRTGGAARRYAASR